MWSPASTKVFLVAYVGHRSQFGARLVDPHPVDLGKTLVLLTRDTLLFFEQEWAHANLKVEGYSPE